jgi:hypothetical protein
MHPTKGKGGGGEKYNGGGELVQGTLYTSMDFIMKSHCIINVC